MNTLKIEHKNNYVIVEIDNGKVNAIDVHLVKEISEVFTKLEADESVKGIILTGRPHCFSAGLDIVTLAKGTAADVNIFWQNYVLAVQAMIRFSKPFVCAITGYAPAGATILTLCADYSIMGKGAKHKIGMHEFRFSMLIPELFCDIYAYQIGEKKAWQAVQQGRLFNSDEALEIGLVDESVEVEEVLDRAEIHLQKQINVLTPTFQKTKAFLRKDLLKIINRPMESLVAEIATGWEDPTTQASIKQFLASLNK